MSLLEALPFASLPREAEVDSNTWVEEEDKVEDVPIGSVDDKEDSALCSSPEMIQERPADAPQRPVRSSYRTSPLCPASPSFDQDGMLNAVYDEMLARQEQARKAVVVHAQAIPVIIDTAASSRATSRSTSPSSSPAPALPQRSALRTSRMLPPPALYEMNQKKISVVTGGGGGGSCGGREQGAEPHDVYLSSEEDVSSSADDFSESEDSPSSDDGEAGVLGASSGSASSSASAPGAVSGAGSLFDSHKSRKSPVKGGSRQDTARVVSVVFSGRPSIVNLSPSTRSSSPTSLIDMSPPRVLERAATDSSLGSALSTCGSGSTLTPNAAAAGRRLSGSSAPYMSLSLPLRHPPRTSSMYGAAMAMGAGGAGGLAGPGAGAGPNTLKKRPALLSIDPFGTAGSSRLDGRRSIREEEVAADEEDDFLHPLDGDGGPTPRTAKTPSAMFRRGLSLVRKRSQPLLAPFRPDPRDIPAVPALPTLHIQTTGPGMDTRTELEPGVATPLSTMSLPMRGHGSNEFLRVSGRKSSSSSSTPISPAHSPLPSPGRHRGKILGFRRQSLSFRPGMAA